MTEALSADYDQKLILHAYDNTLVYLARLNGYAQMRLLQGDLDIAEQVRLSTLDDLLYLSLNVRRFLEISKTGKFSRDNSVPGVQRKLLYSEKPIDFGCHSMPISGIMDSLIHSTRVQIFLCALEIEACETDFMKFLKNLDMSRIGTEPSSIHFSVESSKKRGFFSLIDFLERLSRDVLSPAVDQIEETGFSIRKGGRGL